jgi:hypothetical protein
MKKSELKQMIKEELEKYKGGLYQAKIGDMLWIGISGMVGKDRSTVTKILPDGKIVDSIGNTYNPDGRLYKSTNPRWQKKTNPGKVVSAKIVTQSDLDKEYKKIKVDFLRKFDWDKMNIEDIEKIIDQLPVKQANKLNTSRFS